MHFLQILDDKSDWSWFDAFSFANPLRKAPLEAGAGLKQSSFTNPLRKARLEAGAGLKHFPLQVL